MTVEGAEKLKKELTELKSKVRPKIILAIKEAREKGDLKENAEYHAAREQQRFTEGRIRDIESKISNAEIIDIKKMPKTGKAVFSSTVTLINLEDNKKVTYKIVGEDAVKRANEGKMSDSDAAIVKVFCSEMLNRASDNTVQLYGGMGLMEELPIQRLWRDSRLERIWDGTSEIQRHIITRSILTPLGA